MHSETTPKLHLTLLPAEMLHLITDWLSSADITALSRTCQRLQDLVYSKGIARSHLEGAVPFSHETQRARMTGEFGRMLRAREKRLDAIRSLNPFAAAVVAYADQHMYRNGMLVYTRDRTLFMLSLAPDTTVRREISVDMRTLLDATIPESRPATLYTFRPLYYADGVVSCVYAHRLTDELGQETWLVFFNPWTGWQTSCRIPHPHHRLFVRNNERHLVYGIYTARSQLAPPRGPGRVPPRANEDEDADADADEGGVHTDDDAPLAGHYFSGVDETGGALSHRYWRIRHYDMASQTWAPWDSMQLDAVLGLGAFDTEMSVELFGQHLYVLSNSQRFLDPDHELSYVRQPTTDDFVFDGDSDQASDDEARLLCTDIDADTNTRAALDRYMDLRQSVFGLGSLYTCSRVGLASPGSPVLEQATLKSRFRRLHTEALRDDRFTTLRLEQNTATGAIEVAESVKEWRDGRSRRTYYRQPLVFASDVRAKRRQAKHAKTSVDSKDSKDTSPRAGCKRKAVHAPPTRTPVEPRAPTEDLIRPAGRSPHNVHLGDDCDALTTVSAAMLGGQFYCADAGAFVDLVGRHMTHETTPQRLMLRGGSRTRRRSSTGGDVAGAKRARLQPAELGDAEHEPCTRASDDGDEAGDVVKGQYASAREKQLALADAFFPAAAIRRMYESAEPAIWPPGNALPKTFGRDNGTDVGVGDSDCDCDDNVDVDTLEAADKADTELLLNAILSPDGCRGGLTSAWDNRVLVYATAAETPDVGRTDAELAALRSTKGKRVRNQSALVVVSFDPTLCLAGLKSWDRPDLRAGEHTAGNEAQHVLPAPWAVYTEPAYVALDHGFDFTYRAAD